MTKQIASSVVWHDVECASYVADLPLWRELAAARGDTVLDLGCGTGRVALDLAAAGHEVTGLDSDGELVAALTERAAGYGLAVRAEAADVRSFSLGARFPLAIAPMQVAQLLDGASGRQAMLAAARAHLEPGGLLAVALADPFEGVPAEVALPPLPDVREEGGWVFSSTPVMLRSEPEAVAIDRLRSSVSPAGELTETAVTIRLDRVAPGTLEEEGERAGYRPLPRRHVAETADHVGSTVVLLEAP
jgi:SAM-dependent methyltransferase